MFDYKAGESFGQLPAPGHGIAYWGGGAPDISGLLMQGTAQGQQALQDWFNRAAGYLAPWRDAGGTALNQLAGLLGLPGYKALDPTSVLTATPGYNFLKQQGITAQDLSAASKGMALSGAQQKGLADWTGNLALNKAWAPYMSSLTGLETQGLGAAGQTGGWAMSTGENMAQLDMSAAQALAQQQILNARANAASGQDIMTALGMGAGVLMAPFTGGTSLLGSGMSALQGLFGGGGSGVPASSFGGASDAVQQWGMGLPSSTGVQPFGGSLSAMGYYADGGPVRAGQTAVVGERGPEIVTFDRPGYVIPNHALVAREDQRMPRGPLPPFVPDMADRPWAKEDPGYVFPAYSDEAPGSSLRGTGGYAMLDLINRSPRLGLSTRYGDIEYAGGGR